MMTGTNGYEWMRMDTNGYEWYVCSHGGCTARWQWDQKRSFLFSKWTWCGVESFVTLALEDVESILSYQRQILGQILKALKEIETVGWAIAFAHCLSEESPGGGQPFSLVIDFSWPLDIVYTFVQCIWSTTFYTLIGYMWEERRLEEALMLVTPHFVVFIPGKMFLISADLFPTLSRCRLFG